MANAYRVSKQILLIIGHEVTPITVKELKALLNRFNDDSYILYQTEDGQYMSIESVGEEISNQSVREDIRKETGMQIDDRNFLVIYGI